MVKPKRRPKTAEEKAKEGLAEGTASREPSAHVAGYLRSPSSRRVQPCGDAVPGNNSAISLVYFIFSCWGMFIVSCYLWALGPRPHRFPQFRVGGARALHPSIGALVFCALLAQATGSRLTLASSADFSSVPLMPRPWKEQPSSSGRPAMGDSGHLTPRSSTRARQRGRARDQCAAQSLGAESISRLSKSHMKKGNNWLYTHSRLDCISWSMTLLTRHTSTYEAKPMHLDEDGKVSLDYLLEFQ